MKPKREQLRELLALVDRTAANEIDCEEFLAQAAAYLEVICLGGAIPEELRSAAQHLTVCRDCGEEFDALLEMYETNKSEGEDS